MSVDSVLPPAYASPLPRRPAAGVAGRSTTSVRSRYRRQTAALMIATTVVGLWFGLGAPAVSPVAPTVTSSATGTAGGPVVDLTPTKSGGRIPGAGPPGGDGHGGHRR